MEEIRAYIESGILELYVLDQLSDQERKEVEEMAAKYPEINQEISSIEIAMEKYALHNAVEPSEDLGVKILDRIKGNEVQPTSATIEIPKVSIATADSNVLVLHNNIRNLKISLAACASLLLVSLIVLYTTNDKLNEANTKIAVLNVEKERFVNSASDIQKLNTELQLIVSINNDINWKKVKLSGTSMDPSANILIYWNVNSQEVILDHSTLKLPANDADHQYQLWALVDGKPVDLGVFDVSTENKAILLNMKQITGAQTFAVTLEKRGGSVNPTLEKMIVAGNVAI